jgi:hypothetical protein
MIATLGLLLALAAPPCDAPRPISARAVEARVQIWTASQIERFNAGIFMPDQTDSARLFASVVARGETIGEIAAQGLAAALDRRPGLRPKRLFVSVLRPGAVLPFEVEAVRHGKTAYTLLLETPVEICR